ncbi:MAG: hypothetical protein DMD72_00675 [Gemmatimonadetes bacterium]|nr:MAG: hypothetical protein DMD72_00675 [Gemmatimonadota bacterium]PYO80687.1 MAG: hypothetical protein DMD63_00455 [Gemmatimonadota bacterium]
MMRVFSTRLRLMTGSLTLVGAALVSGCLKSTEPQPSTLQLDGSWNYTGIQTGPVRETLTGTLSISRESGTSFQGRLDLVAVNSQTGQSRVLGGLVSGSESGGDVIDFDADVETNPRRHVGQIVADTVSGTWVGSATDGTMTSGTFRVERVSQ